MNNITERIGEMIGNDDLRGAVNYLHSILKNSPKLNEVITARR